MKTYKKGFYKWTKNDITILTGPTKNNEYNGSKRSFVPFKSICDSCVVYYVVCIYVCVFP